MKRYAFVLAAILVAAGCSRGERSAELATRGSALSPGTSLLPAYALPWEGQGGGSRTDAASDWRVSHPDWYAITAPPVVASRRLPADTEPVQTVLVTLSSQAAADATIRAELVAVARHAIRYAGVLLVVEDEAAGAAFRQTLAVEGATAAQLERLETVTLELDEIWVGDYGPLALLDDAGRLAFLDTRYYAARAHDDAVPSRLAGRLGVTTYRMPFDLEGGNLLADGAGRCFTSERAFDGAAAHDELVHLAKVYAGCQELVVLRDLEADATGHVDMFLKVLSPTLVVLASYTPEQDPVAAADMDWNAALLAGLGLDVVRMPQPDHYVDPAFGFEMARSYLNATLVAGSEGQAVLWPVYEGDGATRGAALAVWENVLDGWDIVPIPSDGLAAQGGAIHCVTRTVPAGILDKWVPDGLCVAGVCDAPAGGYDGACGPAGACVGPYWYCASAWCAFEAAPCSTDEDCDDSDACTTDTCVGQLCTNEAKCEPPLACVPETGECVSCVPECSGRQCGDDGCGGSCGTCTEGLTCFVGACVEGCGGLPFEGCCEGNRAWWCDPQTGALASVECDPSQGGDICTWTGQYGYYCAPADQGDDPGGLPRECRSYVSCETDADCDDNYPCTDDACVDQLCTNTPIPECVCEPECGDRVCGSDPVCGESCGTCAEGQICTADGACEQDPTSYCEIMPAEGCCEGTALFWCQDGQLNNLECADQEPPNNACGYVDALGYFDCGGADPLAPGVTALCPWSGDPCSEDANCDDDDPCTANTCLMGRCRFPTVADCCYRDVDCDDAYDCTTDTCVDNRCAFAYLAECSCSAEGDCDDGRYCTDDACTDGNCTNEHIPGCCVIDLDCEDGDSCTRDFCRDNVCQNSQIVGCCNADSDCELDGDLCTADVCSDAVCRSSIVECDNPDHECNPNTGECGPPCVPDCRNKECGANGCGGQCGSCEQGWVCDGGRCRNRCDCTGMQCGRPAEDCPECGTCPEGTFCDMFDQCSPIEGYDAGGTASDASGVSDASGDTTSTQPPSKGGGGCAAASGTANPFPLLLLALLAVALLPRRRTERT